MLYLLPYYDKQFLEGYRKGFEDAKNMYMNDLAELYLAMKKSKPLEDVSFTATAETWERV